MDLHVPIIKFAKNNQGSARRNRPSREADLGGKEQSRRKINK